MFGQSIRGNELACGPRKGITQTTAQHKHRCLDRIVRRCPGTARDRPGTWGGDKAANSLTECQCPHEKLFTHTHTKTFLGKCINVHIFILVIKANHCTFFKVSFIFGLLKAVK